MSGIGRLRARISSSNDEGSAVIVLPILGLLVFAGTAALAGIALQPDDPATPPPSPSRRPTSARPARCRRPRVRQRPVRS